MRPLRILESPDSSVTCVHLMSRIIERRMIFDEIAKEQFRELSAKQCAFYPSFVGLCGFAVA